MVAAKLASAWRSGSYKVPETKSETIGFSLVPKRRGDAEYPIASLPVPSCTAESVFKDLQRLKA